MTDDQHTPDLRGLAAALPYLSPVECWDAIQQLSAAASEPEPNQYLVTCRYCGDAFWTAREPKGTKWTQMCTSCLYNEV